MRESCNVGAYRIYRGWLLGSWVRGRGEVGGSMECLCVCMQTLQRERRTFQKQESKDLQMSKSKVAWLYVEEYNQFRVTATEAQRDEAAGCIIRWSRAGLYTPCHWNILRRKVTWSDFVFEIIINISQSNMLPKRKYPIFQICKLYPCKYLYQKLTRVLQQQILLAEN